MTIKLWQTLEKEHLDLYDQLSDDEWEDFVEENEDAFAEFTSQYGSSLFINYLHNIKDNKGRDNE